MSQDAIHLRFDQDTFPLAGDRVEAWRDAMSISADVVYLPEDVESFEGRMDFFKLGEVLLVDVRATPHTLMRNKATRARVPLDHVILDVFPTGGLVGQFDGAPTELRQGDCVVVDLKGTFRVRLTGPRYIGIVMPRPLFQERASSAVAVHGLVFRSADPEASLLIQVVEAIIQQAPRLPEPIAASLGLSLVTLIAACAMSQAKPVPGNRPTSPAPTLPLLQRYIDRNASDPNLDTDRLCAKFKLSRTALYRLFKPTGGVAQVIRQRRAAHALQSIIAAGPQGKSIEEIARANGFPDSRSLRRAFLEFYGTSPSDIRRSPPSDLIEEVRQIADIGALFDGV